MKKKYNIEITRSQMNVFIKALDWLTYSIIEENDGAVPNRNTSYYIAKRWQNKLMELKNE
jgi:hypothetical protein|tara:strand:- start:451 stop:630 length:180 start_codon:yes stop_codon:yes gene_type:complete